MIPYNAAAATGNVRFIGAGAAEGDYVVIGDGVLSKTFEWDHGSYATGSLEITGIPADGSTLTIGDGTKSVIFEFDAGDKATGIITLTANPADGNTVTINDGTQAATVFEFDAGVFATGSITLTDQPADGNTITLNDGTNPAKTFEFNSGGGVTEGNINVMIGDTKEDTMVLLIAAINAESNLTITAAPSVPADNACTLTADTADTTHNVAVTKVGANITVAGLSGGLAPGAGPVTGTNTPVAIGTTKEATIVNLIAAINGVVATLLVTASPSVPADNSCHLENESVGVAGNVTITKVGTNIAVGGMAGGTAAGDGAMAVGRIPVAAATDGDAATTMAALVVAINSEGADLGITATAADPADNTCTLANDATGVIGNVAIVTDCEELTSVVGMSGGQDVGGTEVTAGSISLPTETGTSNQAITLADAIVASGLNLIVTPVGSMVRLEHRVDGSAGNVTITKSGTNIAVTGMTGGLDPYASIIAQTAIQTNDDLTYKTVATRLDDLTDAIPS